MKGMLLILLVSSMLLSGCSHGTSESPSVANNTAVTGSSNQSTPIPSNSTESPPAHVWSGGINLLTNPSNNDAFQLTSISTSTKPYHFHVTGKMQAFEAVGNGLLTVGRRPVLQGDASVNGVVILHASAGAPTWGDFSVDFQYPAALSGRVGVLTFYVISPKDGSRQNVLDVTLILP